MEFSQHLYQKEITEADCQKLSVISQTDLAKLDLDKLLHNLTQIHQNLQFPPQLESLRKKLARAGFDYKVKSDYHFELKDKYQKTKSELDTPERKAELWRLKQIINKIYAIKNPDRVEEEIRSQDLEDLDDCVEVECPITFNTDKGFILFKKPENMNMLYKVTTKYYQTNPFLIGKCLGDLFTPGIFSWDVVSELSNNPFSRESIYCRLPLSTNPKVIASHLSRLLGSEIRLDHLVPGYVAAISQVYDKEWIQKDPVRKQVLALMQKTGWDKRIQEILSDSVAGKNPENVKSLVQVCNIFYPNMYIPLESVPKESFAQKLKLGPNAQTIKMAKGDLISLAKKGSFDLIAHTCNCYHVMSAGLPHQMATEFPECKEVDLKIPKGNGKLGTVGFAKSGNLIIANMYCINYFRKTDQYQNLFNYDAFRKCLQAINREFGDIRIGFPQFGTGLARGDWAKISGIIDEEMKGSDVTVVIFKK